jgi:ribonuclease HI
MKGQHKITILQYNTRRSLDIVMAPLMRDPGLADIDIIAIQEPWCNNYGRIPTTHHPRKDVFDLVYPKVKGARVCFLINKRIDMRSWSTTKEEKDYCSIRVKCNTGPLHIHNIYNPQSSTSEPSPIPEVIRSIHRSKEETRENQHVIVGDFNLHHPRWGGAGARRSKEAGTLIEGMEREDMEILLPRGTITRIEGGNKTTIDLVVATRNVGDTLIRCGVKEELHHDSDHLPILTELDLSYKERPKVEKRAWKRMEAEKFKEHLKRMEYTALEEWDKDTLDNATEELIRNITEAATKTTPKLNLSKYSREGWNKECKEIQMDTRRKRREAQRSEDPGTWEEYRILRNQKGRLIKKTRQMEHRERVEQATADPRGLWKLAKWARNRESPIGRISKLQTPQGTLTDEPLQKAKILSKKFFPPPPAEVDTEDIRRFQYTTPKELGPITQQEIKEAIKGTSPDKAPGPDGLTNRVIHHAMEAIMPQIHHVYKESLRLGHCPKTFRHQNTVAVPKPGKGDYTVAKSYRPIALLSTLGKGLEKVMAVRLRKVVDSMGVLPKQHYGGRTKTEAEHAIHAITERTYEAWQKKEVASLLLLDVTGAFDNVSHERLIHNLRKRRIDKKTTEWIQTFLQNRTTTISFDGYTTETMEVDTGIPQGSPLSPILYLFYNADLVEIGNDQHNVITTGYVDDIAILTHSQSTKQNCKTLAEIHEKAKKWGAQHASKFDESKYQLVHFTRRTERHRKMEDHNQNQEVQLNNITIKAEASVKYLGVIMDNKLRWKDHIRHAEAKATKSIGAMAAISRSTWGATLLDIRKLYISIVIPQFTYAASVWHNPVRGTRIGTRQGEGIKALERLQYKAVRVISGAFRATSKPALDIETYLLPATQRLDKTVGHTFLRLATSPNGTHMREMMDMALPSGQKGRYTPLRALYHTYSDILDWKGRVEKADLRSNEGGIKGNTYMEQDKEKALQRHKDLLWDRSIIHIYTDAAGGGGGGGGIGAAAISIRPPTFDIRVHLGTENKNTIQIAEVYGLKLASAAAKIMTEVSPTYKTIRIFTDSQGAIRALWKSQRRAGQTLIQEIISNTKSMEQRGGIKVEYHWVPAHKGIEGNEAADQSAKGAAAGGENTATDHIQTRPAMLKHLERTIEQAWANTWRNEGRGRTLYRLTKQPTKAVLALHRGLTKAESSLLIQMRTEKIGLKGFLHARGVPGYQEDNKCSCSRRNVQSVIHILMECPKLRGLREEKLFQEPGSLRNNLDLRHWLGTPEQAKKVTQFMMETELLVQYQAVRRKQREEE